MSDPFKGENHIIRAHAQTMGRIKPRQQQGETPRPHQHQRQQGDTGGAFGDVGLKSEPKRNKPEISQL